MMLARYREERDRLALRVAELQRALDDRRPIVAAARLVVAALRARDDRRTAEALQQLAATVRASGMEGYGAGGPRP